MKNFLTLSVCASALMLAACGSTAEQGMQVPDDAAVPTDAMMSSSDAMMSSSDAMMSSSEDGAMMKVKVDAGMQSSGSMVPDDTGMMKSSEAATN